jgi:hypothetical protein
VTHPGWGTEWAANSIPEESPDDRDTRRSQQHKKRRPSHHVRRTVRRVLFTVTLLLALAIGAVAWVGVDALKAHTELKAAAAQVHLLQTEVQRATVRAPRSR